MQMLVKRMTVEALLCCIFSVISMHLIPASYVVHQIYEVAGQLELKTGLPQKLTLAIRSQLKDLEMAPGVLRLAQCASTASPIRFHCSSRTEQRAGALRIHTAMKELVPTRVGWIPKETLENRFQSKQSQMTMWEQEIKLLEQELQTLEIKRVEFEATSVKEQKNKILVSTEISNRKKQLELIEEAIPVQTSANILKRFQSKKDQILHVVANLERKLVEIEKTISFLTESINRYHTITEILPKVRAQIDLSQEQISIWSTLLSNAKDAALVADPQEFQLAAIETPGEVYTTRNWKHFPWSIPFGFLLFAFTRRKTLNTIRNTRFQSSKEIEKETGLRYLGDL